LGQLTRSSGSDLPHTKTDTGGGETPATAEGEEHPVASGRQRFSIISDGLPTQLPDIDQDETREWVESFDTVVRTRGRGRARYIMLRLLERAREQQVGVPGLRSTDYINTIPPEREPWFPGDEYIERRIRAYIRWNAAVMVSRANRAGLGVGGHIATYASAASLYEVGFNHFFRGKDHGESGDQVFIQGHAAPGIYARAFLEGRLTEHQLNGFRQELSHPGGGLPSYPHPRLMPDFWEFPTVSMGLGAINAVYQARFNRYLLARQIKDTSRSHVWAFLGDGETDEPEVLGSIGLAAREELDNLTFVINCNLQRLDGPVRGNGKIIQELEASFRGAGWNVIKVIWGRDWDPLLALDTDGVLVNKMNSTPDGQFQTYGVETGAYIRENFFGGDPRLRAMVEHLSDDQLRNLSRGGHDYRKVYAAFKAATEHVGQPTVILAHTIKGWTLGPDFEARNATHQMKKLTVAELKSFRDRLYLEIPDAALEAAQPPYYHPGEQSDEIQYMLERRAALGGFLPKRVVRAKPLALTGEAAYQELRKGSGKQSVATTMAFVRLLKDLMKDPEIGERFVPIIPDEARTFGMDSLFPTAKIYSPYGQRYDAVDRNLLLSYKESEQGQILHEGISEAGAMGSTIAAGTAYATHGTHMIPVYIFYSMFGFQRTGDQLWSFGDQLGRGFLLGATAGRTTLTGEGLQHNDGHSVLLSSVSMACISYDAAWAYELSYIVRDALRRMYSATPDHPEGENIFYYLTIYNEPYVQPAEPADFPGGSQALEQGILRGFYRYSAASGPTAAETPGTSAAEDTGQAGDPPRAQILASGVALRWALQAQRLLADDWGVLADAWSATSWTELRRDALACDEWNLLHPDEEQRVPYVAQALDGHQGPVVAVSDWIRAVPDQIARWVPAPFTSLGTDGWGFSDTRPAARRFFNVDAESITVAVLSQLARLGEVKPEIVGQAIAKYRLDRPVSEAL
jgi:pyruvate dehydrogenase E1 component